MIAINEWQMSLDDLEIISGEEVKGNLQAGDLEKLARAFMEETHPEALASTLETRKSIEDALGYLSEAIDKGDMVIARKNGEIAGMERGYLFTCRLYADPESKDFVRVIEIGKAVVMPNFRRQGIFKKINSQLIKNLSEKYPNTGMLVGTRSPSVRKIFIDEGWKEVTFDWYLKIHNASDDEVKNEMKIREKAGGWTAFLYRP